MEEIRKPLSVDEVLECLTEKMVEINKIIDLLEVRGVGVTESGYVQTKRALIIIAAIRACKGFGKEAESLFPQ